MVEDLYQNFIWKPDLIFVWRIWHLFFSENISKLKKIKKSLLWLLMSLFICSFIFINNLLFFDDYIVLRWLINQLHSNRGYLIINTERKLSNGNHFSMLNLLKCTYVLYTNFHFQTEVWEYFKKVTMNVFGKTAILTPKSNDIELKKFDFS